MRTMIGIFAILAAIALAIWAWVVILPDFYGGSYYWFVLSVIVFVAAAGVLIGALLIERDLNP